MGTVFREQDTAPLPQDAEIATVKGEQVAHWKPGKGRAKTASVTTGKDGSLRIVIRSATYSAKYRDGQGIVRKVTTGCRDEGAARSVLGELERRAELVKSGVMTAGEDAIADHASTPIAAHFRAYHDHRIAQSLNAVRIANTDARLTKLAGDCGFRRLADLSADGLTDWLGKQLAVGMSAGTRNEYRQELVGFGNWCVKTRRLIQNPFTDVPKANAKSDCRRQRRAMTEAELGKLLHVARWRPLAEYGRETIKADVADDVSQKANWTAKPLTFHDIDDAVESARVRLANNPEFVAKLEHRGRERQLVYKTLVTTGLRKGELASVKLRHLNLDAERAFLALDAASEKNRQGNSIPLRADLAEDLRRWLADRLATQRKAAQNAPTLKFNRKVGRNGRGIQYDAEGALRLSPDEPLFTVPSGLVRILNRDLEAAGIPKCDDRGRTLDVHALRHTFGTMLSTSGVAPRTAMSAMRHSSIDLTMATYTDPRLLDVHGAVESLPTLSLTASRQDAPEVFQATGTMGDVHLQLAPMLAPTSGKPCLLVAYTGTQSEHFDSAMPKMAAGENAYDSSKKALSEGDSDKAFGLERRGVGPPTSALRTQRSPN